MNKSREGEGERERERKAGRAIQFASDINFVGKQLIFGRKARK